LKKELEHNSPCHDIIASEKLIEFINIFLSGFVVLGNLASFIKKMIVAMVSYIYP